ncbi:GNAT family N-acetyltransferase [Flavobacterium granuli]|uniref:Ribosomal protein S18 acetylase RimI-like enzyme n=1 Tax=Flavobacterium granuli TaxID=280093 RepID=A0ABU1S645_9FLAO|nr:GNAT family N-acetyltransferase [Flavobacterium granuli]MDR6845599.1 ribosomal protein S18 acetylase RimI-like enzyme [Flavobacterium granuli]
MVKIKKAEYSDVENIKPLFLNIMEYHSTFNEIFEYDNDEISHIYPLIYKYIDENNSDIFIAEINNQIVGYIICTKIERPRIFKLKTKGRIDGLYVSSNIRNSNIGSKLLDTAVEWFGIVDYIEIEYTNQNNLAENFWKNKGFKLINNYCINNFR